MKLRMGLLVALLAGVFSLTIFNPIQVIAQDPSDAACSGLAVTGANCGEGESELTSTIQVVINILLFVIGVASVIMLVVGALRYTLSAGDAQAAASAKNTIIYAIIGIVVAVMAFLIASFIFDQVSGDGGSAPAPGPGPGTFPV